MLRAESLSKTFTTAKGDLVHAVREASFEAQAGEVFGLLGPNGAGKTTLLRMLGTIITPSSGACWIDGLESQQAPEQIRRKIGFLSGNTRLYGRLTAREILFFFGQLYGMEKKAIGRRVEVVADLLDMHEFLDRRCDTLSTGQTQKVSIARVIVHEPQVLILDEPTLGLDIITSQAIVGFIKQARSNGACILFSTHYMTEAELLCDRVAFIYQGRIMASGGQAELMEKSGSANLHDAFLAMVAAQRGGNDEV